MMQMVFAAMFLVFVFSFCTPKWGLRSQDVSLNFQKCGAVLGLTVSSAEA